jgi:hypothetical protein
MFKTTLTRNTCTAHSLLLPDTGGKNPRPVSLWLCKAFVTSRNFGKVLLHKGNAAYLFAAVAQVEMAVAVGLLLPALTSIVLLFLWYAARLPELEETVGIAKGSELWKAVFGETVRGACSEKQFSGFNEWFKKHVMRHGVLTFEEREERAMTFRGAIGTTDEAWSFIDKFLGFSWIDALDPGTSGTHVGEMRNMIEKARRQLASPDPAAAADLMYCGEHGVSIFDTMP